MKAAQEYDEKIKIYSNMKSQYAQVLNKIKEYENIHKKDFMYQKQHLANPPPTGYPHNFMTNTEKYNHSFKQ